MVCNIGVYNPVGNVMSCQRKLGTTRGIPDFQQANQPLISLVTRFMGPAWGPSGADRTQVGPMLAPWTLLSGMVSIWTAYSRRMGSRCKRNICWRHGKKTPPTYVQLLLALCEGPNRSTVLTKGQHCGAFVCSLLFSWISYWANSCNVYVYVYEWVCVIYTYVMLFMRQGYIPWF